MMNIVNSSTQSELSRFFQTLEHFGKTVNTVTTAAFSKARLKFSHCAFLALNTVVTDLFYRSAFVKRWHGKRLLAVDGSTANLPNSVELQNHFGKLNPQANQPSVRLSQLYDVMNQLSVDIIASEVAVGERALAAKHLAKAQKDDVILYDRGYPAFWLFALHQQQGIDFYARVSVDFSRDIKGFMASKDKDIVVELHPSNSASIKECQDRNIPTTAINVRLIKVVLDNGDTEVLITSLLDQTHYKRANFKTLYHQRWFVEEDYKVMKSRLEIENFTGLSVEAVLQDIYAKVLTKNMAAVAIVEANVITQQKVQHRKRNYKINFTYTLGQLKYSIIGFCLRLSNSPAIVDFIQRISQLVDAVRLGRKFERKMKKIGRNKRSMAYKRVG